LERGLPAEARTELANEDDQIYIADFIKARATNDALEAYNIMPVAIPHVKTAGLSSGSPYTCYVHVYPRREIGLTSLDPVELKTNRVAKPGFSAQAAQDGGDVEFIDDEKVQEEVGTEKYDIVAANILADVLIPLTPHVVPTMKAGAYYITSGILEGREDSVAEAMREAGLEVISVTAQGEWRCVVGRKPLA
jgi:ribosomal protein L11 methyltransferase